MRKFKLFFYPLYLIAAFGVLYFGIDILNNMDAYKERLDMTFALRKLPIYLMATFIVLSLMMIIELALENFQIISLKRQLKKANEEVLKYKAKLYDQSQTEEEDEADDEEDAPEDEADEDEDDD